MEDLSDRLAAIGFRRTQQEPGCWRLTRVGGPAAAPQRRIYHDPAKSRALARWLDRLSDRRKPSPFQISLTTHITGAARRSGLS